MKIKKSDLLNMIQEQSDVIAKLIRQVNCHHEDIIRLESIIEPEPQLKQLDQSVFDGAHEMWRFASVDADGAGFRFSERPELTDCFWRNVNCSRFDRLSQSGAYGTSNWQNSLIERDTTKELTGSDLARAMLANASKPIMCAVSDISTSKAMSLGNYDLIHDYTDEHSFMSLNQTWVYAIPINNQGEPLTASEVGL